MRPLGKGIRAATAEAIPWKAMLQTFLRSYRESSHLTTGKPPAEVLFNIKFWTILPCAQSVIQTNIPDIRDKDAKEYGQNG